MFVDFSKVYVVVTYRAKPFFQPEHWKPVFSHGISRNFASAIDRPCSYRAVGGMGSVMPYSYVIRHTRMSYSHDKQDLLNRMFLVLSLR